MTEEEEKEIRDEVSRLRRRLAVVEAVLGIDAKDEGEPDPLSIGARVFKAKNAARGELMPQKRRT